MPELVLTDADAPEVEVIENKPVDHLINHRTSQAGQQLAQWRKELDGYYEIVKQYHLKEPDEVLVSISALSARFSEIRSHLTRMETNKRAQAFRTKEVDPFLDALDLQFKIHSRLLTFRELDFRMTGGAPA